MAADSLNEQLFEWYRRYIGEPETATDVYLGFALFFGGIACGVVGLVLFLLSGLYAPSTDPTAFWTLREVAISLAAVGLPVFMVGIVVLLPVGDRARYAAAAGTAVCLLAVALFVAVYPEHWNVRGVAEYSAQGITLYAVGLVAVIAATGAALVAHHLDRAAGTPTADAVETGPTVTDEQVRRDIDEAMANADITWGGVARDRTKRLTIRSEEKGLDRSGFDSVEAKTYRSESVEDAIASLKSLKGGEKRTARSTETTDDAASALKQLRERKRAEELAEAPGLVGKIRSFLRRR